MSLPNTTKHMIFIGVSSICVAACVYLDLSGIYLFQFLLILGLITIIGPLGAGLYVYKGKLARLAFILACIGMLLALIFAVDSLATRETFKDTCQSIGSNWKFTVGGDYYACSGNSEKDYLWRNTLSTPITDIAFWPYGLVTLLGIVNLLYLPVGVVRRRVKE